MSQEFIGELKGTGFLRDTDGVGKGVVAFHARIMDGIPSKHRNGASVWVTISDGEWIYCDREFPGHDIIEAFSYGCNFVFQLVTLKQG
jgi:hypothetical protein